MDTHYDAHNDDRAAVATRQRRNTDRRRYDDRLDNPRPVLDAWRQYLAQLIHDDQWYGQWFAWSLTTKMKPARLAQHLTARIWSTTGLSPSASRNDLRTRGICVLLIPSVSAADTHHYHGLLRVPRTADWCEVMTDTHGVGVVIDAPAVVESLFTKDDKALGSLFIQHSNERADVLTHQSAFDRCLTYFAKVSDGELRDFANAIWVPHEVRLALPNANTCRTERTK